MKNITKLKYIIAMFIYGTIGVVSYFIDLPSGLIVLCRGILGIIVLLIYLLIKRQKPDFRAMKKNLLWLALAGLSLGGNWICLFTSYRLASVSVGTLCNYFAPVVLLLISPFVLKEKLTIKKVLCICVALVGMVFVSGIIENGFTGVSAMAGFFVGLGSAACYVGIVIFNKQLKDIGSYDRVIAELFFAVLLMLPYTIFTTDFTVIQVTVPMVLLVLLIGILHTGIAYVLYFGSLGELPAQTIAIYSYIEPIVSIALSVIILRENLGVLGYIGAFLLLGALLISEIQFTKRKQIGPVN